MDVNESKISFLIDCIRSKYFYIDLVPINMKVANVEYHMNRLSSYSIGL